MPDEQLLTKQVIGDDLDATGRTIAVRFNLQRGKIARIWGFRVDWSAIVVSTNSEWQVFVRKTQNAPRAVTVPDLLWSSIHTTGFATGGGFADITGNQVMFPKPHRTSGITIQMHRTNGTGGRALLIIYYDIDDVAEGELANRWEKSRQKKYDRRMLAP